MQLAKFFDDSFISHQVSIFNLKENYWKKTLFCAEAFTCTKASSSSQMFPNTEDKLQYQSSRDRDRVVYTIKDRNAT